MFSPEIASISLFVFVVTNALMKALHEISIEETISQQDTSLF